MLTHRKRKENNPDYQVCILEDHAFKSLSIGVKEFFDALASHLLGIDMKELKNSYFVDKELGIKNKDEKFMVADLLLNAKDNYIINFEANTYNSESIILKNTYYTYRLILNRQSKSSTYKDVKIDQINLDLRPLEFNTKIINTFVLIDKDSNKILPGSPRIMHIALDKFKKDPYNEVISDWLRRALGIILSTSIKKSKKLAGNNPILKKAVKFMEEYSNNYDNLDLLDQQAEFMKAIKTDNEKEKIIIEQKSLEKGLKKGLKDGEVIGSEKKAVENAKNALSLGLDNDTISKITGLSIKEIVALK